ncbi:hypothetical protein GGQ54_000189 [Naumannella cuiyingiana]|uniref:Trp biosynthesis-associated membrane protein n=1 Tax=Naumannella cuiyingiana TaxID=1347891 RepID=A0A7Z0D693_9ACTN|nr:hypothetical protein [Naumannella cuiyingiana]
MTAARPTVPAPVRRLVLGGLLVGIAGAAGAGAGPWWTLTVQARSATFSGGESTAGLAMLLVLAAGAGVLLLLATGRAGRRVVGIVLGALGAAIGVLGASRPAPPPAEVQARLRNLSLAEAWQLDPTPLPWLYALAGLVLVAAALTLAITAPRWPDRSARYRRTAPLAADDPEGWWRALDAGDDPSQDASEVPDSDAGTDPDYHPRTSTRQNGDAERGGHR